VRADSRVLHVYQNLSCFFFHKVEAYVVDNMSISFPLVFLSIDHGNYIEPKSPSTSVLI